ncbi:MAG: hypothetical protein HY820_43235 [Acidobacteria bacterium]|nr:hypothetical protein [Acidobacteriota bacterium]
MPTNEKVLADIQSADKDVRFAAWRAAGEADPSVIAGLAKLVNDANPGVAKAAREAITTFVHSVGKDPAHPKRAAVVAQLMTVAESSGSSSAARVLALRLLSNIAGESQVPAIAKLLNNTELREEAVYCVERIPGDVANKALLAAARSAKDDFKPRLLAALGHRRIADATTICIDAMKSPNREVALAGARAFGRIGRKATAAVPWPKPEDADAVLRYADGLRDQGNTADAMDIYKTMLRRAEEHLQCAAIVGIGKIKTADAAAVLFPMLKHSNSRVRITANNVWKSMA